MNINVPKSMLPNCKVGETIAMKVTAEEGDSFILEPDYEKEEADKPAKGKAQKKSGGKPRAKAVTKALEKGY